MPARVSLITATGQRLDTDLEALLSDEAREQARVDANQFIKRLRLVPYGAETMRTEFSYRGDSLWWFTELYLHKMRRIDAAVAAAHALDAARQRFEPAAIEIATDDPVLHVVATGFGRARGVKVACGGAARRDPGMAWPSYVRNLTARMSRIRRPRSLQSAGRARVAAFIHSAFWRGSPDDVGNPRGEHYIGPVLAALSARLEAETIAYVGVGPRRNFRARRWWDPLRSGTAAPHVMPIERLAPASALRDSRALWKTRRDLARSLTAGDGIRAAAVFDGVDLWPILERELQATACLQWPWSARAMDEAAAALDAIAPDVVLTYAEAGGWGRALVLEARRRGIRSVGLQHGFIYRHWLNYLHEVDELEPAGDTPAFPHPDRTMVFDRLAADHLRRRGRLPASSIVVTGNPRLDDLAARVRSVSATQRNAIRQQLGVPATAPLALLAAKYSEIREEVHALRAAMQSVRGVHLVVKPHPAETREVYAPLAGGIDNVIVAAADSDLAELLSVADLIVTRNSTVAVDGLVLGIPSLVFGLPNNLSPFVAAGAMAGARDARELAGRLEALLYNLGRRQQLAEAGKAFVSQAGLRADGRAAERTADAILELRRS